MPQFSVSLASLGSRAPAISFGASTPRPERATLVVGNDKVSACAVLLVLTMRDQFHSSSSKIEDVIQQLGSQIPLARATALE